MDEYIKRTEALEITTRTCGDYAAAWSEIRKLPAADVAPVVRCMDCKHHYDCGVHFCNRLRMDCPDDSDFYCAYGKRKDGGDSDEAD